LVLRICSPAKLFSPLLLCLHQTDALEEGTEEEEEEEERERERNYRRMGRENGGGQ
jgi:hypothetical protein